MTLELERLTKTYAGGSGVADLTLQVPEGQVTALVGPSGAGKSTVMRLVAGLLTPDAGDIRWGGQSILGLPPDRRGVVLMFQNALLFPHLSLAQNVGFGLRMRGMARDRIAVEVTAMLRKVQLDGLGDRRPHELSGGQQGRGALARALILQPRVLLLDEPLANLDPSLRDEMRGLIRQLQRDTGTTMMVVTHDQSEAVVMADRIAVLLDGRLAQEADPHTIFRRPVSLRVARFFGGANFIPGRAENGVFHGPFGPLTLPLGAPEGPGTLTIRPEALRLTPRGPGLPARVLLTEFLGTHSRVTLDLSGARLTALVPPDVAQPLAEGDSVALDLPRDALWMIPESPR